MPSIRARTITFFLFLFRASAALSADAPEEWSVLSRFVSSSVQGRVNLRMAAPEGKNLPSAIKIAGPIWFR